MKSILFALPLALLAGCATQLPPKYTVIDPIAEPLCAVENSGLTVRMSQDIRAYTVPLCFNADGTVKPIYDLTYYAPLEVAIERTLTDVTVFSATQPQNLRITVKDFCIDARGQVPVAKVTLATATKTSTQTAELPLSVAIPELRATLGSLLLEAYRTL